MRVFFFLHITYLETHRISFVMSFSKHGIINDSSESVILFKSKVFSRNKYVKFITLRSHFLPVHGRLKQGLVPLVSLFGVQLTQLLLN